MTAGTLANRIVHHGESPLEAKNVAVALALVVVLLFAGPLLVFTKPLREAKRRGMLDDEIVGTLAKLLF